MIFRIDIEDFWLDDKDELEPELKNHIINTVVQAIWKKLENRVGTEMIQEIHKVVEVEFKGKLDAQFKRIIETQTIGGAEDGPKLDEWLRNQFSNSTSWRDPEQTIKAFAKEFGDEMKERYDMLFASQIVIKMSEQGLLKEGVAESLIRKGEEE